MRSAIASFSASSSPTQPRSGIKMLGTYVFVPTVLGLFAMVVATSWYFVFIPLIMFDDLMKQLLLFVIHANLVVALYMYIKTLKSDPGYLLQGWEPVDLEDRPELYVPSSKEASSTFWCSKCQSHRPHRSHHCRHCDKCVLMFDHHCPWVNNCVGHGNIKLFILFLGYTCSWGAMTFLCFLYRIADIFYFNPENEVGFWNKGALLGIVFFWMLLLLSVFGILQSQVMMAVLNTTNPEKKYLASRLRSLIVMPAPERNELVTKHMSLVFGSNRLMWIFPTAPEADPYNYPVFRCKEEIGALHGSEEDKTTNEGGDKKLSIGEEEEEGEGEEVLKTSFADPWSLRRAKGKEKVPDDETTDLLLPRNTRKEE